ncbi:nicotinamide-nucleotide amidohydrolase family protein [Dietzia sp. 179-F 9C3 NHS]|uniref:nicotinamide-nucleotide amidohydrolase family protein n=1 Tax=Dietzia sp. 179-F 9C3 NHS TaxID=3374295 RepID=UPI003879BCB8
MSARETEFVARLSARGLTVATAESLTAGLLASRIAAVPGASAVLRGGLVVYATDLKHTLAGVPDEVLARHGAVSRETAAALADGARSRCGADVGIGLTGVAGPDLQEGHPAGTVYVGVSGPDGHAEVLAPALRGNRARIREAACEVAIDRLLEILGNETGA